MTRGPDSLPKAYLGSSWAGISPGLALSGTAGAVVAGLLIVVLGPAVGLALLGGATLFAACVYRPVVAVYVYIGTVPILAGIDRGVLIPLVRLNEALFALLLAGAAIGGYVRFMRGDPIGLRLRRVDVPLGVFVVLSTVWPICSLLLRELELTGGEIGAVLPVVKLTALLVLVRLAVTNEAQVLRCVRLVVWPAVVLSVVAILQTLQVGPVLSLLTTFWATDGGAEDLVHRGSSTLASSIATGDYIIISLVLVICCGVRGLLGRRERLMLGIALSAGMLAAGQFSTWLAAALAAALIFWQYPHLLRLWPRFLPLGALAILVGAPALFGRLQGFSEYGVPRSWLGRWDNVVNIHLPHFDPVRVLLGVSPDPVLPAPETWREVVFLEAGYLQFVWIGGLPLLLAFLGLSITLLRFARALPQPATPSGACVSALVIVWSLLLVLTLIDAHLTLRGAGELFFLLLGLATAVLGSDTDGNVHVHSRRDEEGMADERRT